MSVAFHRVPRDMFDALASGGGGPAAIGVLAAAQYSKHVLLLRGVLDAGGDRRSRPAPGRAGRL